MLKGNVILHPTDCSLAVCVCLKPGSGVGQKKETLLRTSKSLCVHMLEKFGELYACRLVPLPAPCSSQAHLEPSVPLHHTSESRTTPSSENLGDFLVFWITCSVVSQKLSHLFIIAFWCLWLRTSSAVIWHGSALSWTMSLFSISLLPSRWQFSKSLFVVLD